MDKKSLRQSMRKKRRDLNARDLNQSSRKMCIRLASQPEFQFAKHIAFYSACAGEIDPIALFSKFSSKQKRFYFPIVTKSKVMIFREYKGSANLKRNRYGIPEPIPKMPSCHINHLDIVLVPLVAFDRSGARLGMGGGYYDRTFAFKLKTKQARPYLIGLAHSFQEVEQLETERWDVKLDAIVTESEIIRC